MIGLGWCHSNSSSQPVLTNFQTQANANLTNPGQYLAALQNHSYLSDDALGLGSLALLFPLRKGGIDPLRRVNRQP